MSAVCYNLLKEGKEANYIQTGFWGKKAVGEASKYCRPNMVIESPAGGPLNIPDHSEWNIKKDASYTYYVENETTVGAEWLDFPYHLFEDQVIVADMSSSLGYRKI